MRNILLLLLILTSCTRTIAQEINLAFIKSISPINYFKYDTTPYKVLETFLSRDTSLKFLKKNFDRIKNPYPDLPRINDTLYLDHNDTFNIMDDPWSIKLDNFILMDINNDKLDDIIFRDFMLPCNLTYIYLNKKGYFKNIFGARNYISDERLTNISISITETDFYFSSFDYMINENCLTTLYVLKKNTDYLEHKWTMIFPNELLFCKEQNITKKIIVISDSSILRKSPCNFDSLKEDSNSIRPTYGNGFITRNKIVTYRKNATGIVLSEIKNSDGQTWCFVVMSLSSVPKSYFYKMFGLYGQKEEPLYYPNELGKSYFIGWMNKNDIKYLN